MKYVIVISLIQAFYITRSTSESTGAISWDGSNDAVSEAALSVRTECNYHHFSALMADIT